MDIVDFESRAYYKTHKPFEVYEVGESQTKDILDKIQIKHATWLRKGKLKGKYAT